MTEDELLALRVLDVFCQWRLDDMEDLHRTRSRLALLRPDYLRGQLKALAKQSAELTAKGEALAGEMAELHDELMGPEG